MRSRGEKEGALFFWNKMSTPGHLVPFLLSESASCLVMPCNTIIILKHETNLAKHGPFHAEY